MNIRLTLLAVLILGILPTASSQYFGQNKPRYSNFDFRVLNTPRFSIYYYLDNRPFIEETAQNAELWYTMHSALLPDTFTTRNPILFYNNHADFQQTKAISGNIGIGTGGVTEGLRNRVVMPFTFTNQQTHHVLGHELVHAFQYNMILRGDSTSFESMGNLPLWMVEGLAEYMSIGRYDAHTAMWMRDAVIHNNIPTYKTINRPEYFPYRWGQAFWAYISGTYGDQVIAPLFMTTAKYGFEMAAKNVLGTGPDALFDTFGESLKSYYGPLIEAKEKEIEEAATGITRRRKGHTGGAVGRQIISDENAGEMNISPAVSPNGRYVIFLSEKNVLSTDLYLADARTGKIIRKITSMVRDGHLDDLSFLESAGTWSPNSKEYAFVAFDKGRNIIVVKDVESGKTSKSIHIKEVPAITNPAWSPDGKTIVFSGLVDGQTDLYSYNLRNGRLTQLTDDKYAEIQPNFNADGTHLAYATDKLSMENGRTHGRYTMNLAVLNMATGKAGQINIFPGADNLNPCFNHEGDLLFISNRDGYRNIYRYAISTGDVFQQTDFLTGVSGITEFSPAISIATDRDRGIYTYFYGGQYHLYQAEAEDMLNIPVPKDSVDFTASTLPAVGNDVQQVIQTNLDNMDKLPLVSADRFADEKYKSKFRLEHAGGSTGIGVSTGTFGAQTGLMGGVELLFGDVLGNHQIYSVLALNGDFRDFGGHVQYLNKKHRIAWGASISHIPYRTGYYSSGLDTLSQGGQLYEVWREDLNIIRIFEDEISAIAQLPFSKITRLEGSFGVTYQSYRHDAYPYYYNIREDNLGNRYVAEYLGAGDRERIPLESDEVYLGNFLAKRGVYYTGRAAYVGDNSTFGMTAPYRGYRYRLAASKSFGTYDFWSTTADGRFYHFMKPVSLAFRLTYNGRYGEDASSFSPTFLGFQGLVHGYDYNQIVKRLRVGDLPDGRSINSIVTEEFYRLSGSKLIVSGMEVRLPFTGPERLAAIPSSFLFTDLSWFFDVGVAYDEFSHFKDGEPIYVNGIDENGFPVTELVYRKPKVAMSTGISLRVNVFGVMILEPYVAYPLEKESRLLFGLNFVPGW